MMTDSSSNLPPTRRFYDCKICNVHGLEYSQANVQAHFASQPHKHMKMFYDNGLWPGIQPGDELSGSQNKIYEFLDQKGTVICKLCQKIAKNGTELLKHQHQTTHLTLLIEKRLQSLIPVLFACDTCDLALRGHEAYLKHNSSQEHLSSATAKQFDGCVVYCNDTNSTKSTQGTNVKQNNDTLVSAGLESVFAGDFSDKSKSTGSNKDVNDKDEDDEHGDYLNLADSWTREKVTNIMTFLKTSFDSADKSDLLVAALIKNEQDCLSVNSSVALMRQNLLRQVAQECKLRQHKRRFLELNVLKRLMDLLQEAVQPKPEEKSSPLDMPAIPEPVSVSSGQTESSGISTAESDAKNSHSKYKPVDKYKPSSDKHELVDKNTSSKTSLTSEQSSHLNKSAKPGLLETPGNAHQSKSEFREPAGTDTSSSKDPAVKNNNQEMSQKPAVGSEAHTLKDNANRKRKAEQNESSNKNDKKATTDTNNKNIQPLSKPVNNSSAALQQDAITNGTKPAPPLKPEDRSSQAASIPYQYPAQASSTISDKIEKFFGPEIADFFIALVRHFRKDLPATLVTWNTESYNLRKTYRHRLAAFCEKKMSPLQLEALYIMLDLKLDYLVRRYLPRSTAGNTYWDRVKTFAFMAADGSTWNFDPSDNYYRMMHDISVIEAQMSAVSSSNKPLYF